MAIIRPFLLCVLSLLSVAPGRAETFVIFAAASLQGALDEAVHSWGGDVVVSYGGSAAQARQVALGAPADLVILAHPVWMDWLVAQNAVIDDSRIDLFGNRLVVIGPEGAPLLSSPSHMPGRLGNGRLAVGETRVVPAGIYTRAWLEEIGEWEPLSRQLAETGNVRQALALVARGQAPLGVVYESDAIAEPAVTVLYSVPAELHPAIRYPAVLVQEGAAPLLNYLVGPEATAIFARHGFRPLKAQQ